MTSANNPEEFPEIDPIREIFIDAGLEDLVSPTEDPAIDLIDRMLNKGFMDERDADNFREARNIDPDRLGKAVPSIFKALDGEFRNSGRGLVGMFARYLEEYAEHDEETGGSEDFVPFQHFSDETNGSGLTLEDWRDLPQSVKDTLRDDRLG